MSPSWFNISMVLALAALVGAHSDRHHTHTLARRLADGTPTTPAGANWYHPDGTPFHKLFRRGPATDGVQYAQVGSPAWSAPYPTSTPDSSAMPQAWKDALNAAVSAGSIPNIPPSSLVNGVPAYPQGVDPNSMPVCSATWKCRLPNDTWDAPDGQLGISFDDGPIPGSSDKLYSFLQQNNINATHFFIGVNILWGPNEFNTAFNMGGDIAVHTWTHPYMTSLSSEDVVAQLGWTMEIIHNSTGGRLPRFWRPPFGDTDARVSAIAKEVFGLQTVIWNQDTEDWSMATTNLTLATVENNLRTWYSGAKSPGLIILEHELTNDTVSAFIDTYSVAVQNGWKPVSVAQLDGKDTPYQNAQGSTGTVTPVKDILVAPAASASSSVALSSGLAALPGNNNAAPTAASAAPATASESAGSKSASGASGQNQTSGVSSALSSNLAALALVAISGAAALAF